MLDAILDALRDERGHDVFLGADRISHREFANLVWTYAGGLRLREARSIALVGRPGPPTLAMLLAAVGTGTRVDWIDPRAGEGLVRARLEAAASTITVAESGLAWPLRGPGWLRRGMGLPSMDTWPEIVPIDHIGAAQQRRFGPEPDAAAMAVFEQGRTEEPLGVVHSVASLSEGLDNLASVCDGDGPVLTDSILVMLACLGAGRPIVAAARRRRVLAAQVRRRKVACSVLHCWERVLAAGSPVSGTVVTVEESTATLARLRELGAERVIRMYALPGLFPIAFSDEPEGPLRLVDGVDAWSSRDGELRVAGPAMAPRAIEGPWLDDLGTGRNGVVDGRRLWLGERIPPPA